MVLVFSALIGLAVGSFINALVFRTHEDIPLSGRSKCLKCERPIDARDLIPVLSFFLLRGRCRGCHASISWQYPAVEFATAVLFVILAIDIPLFVSPDLFSVFYGPLIRNAIFTAFLIIIFVYDLRYSYILDRITVPGMMIAILLNLVLYSIVPGWITPYSMLLGALTLGGFFLLQFVLSKGKWIGGGDIRMGVLMGLMVGFENGLLALFLAYALGAIFGCTLIAAGKKKLGSHVPFGTFLAIGTYVALVWGDAILTWYLGNFV